MAIIARKMELREIQTLRAVFLQETGFQVRYDACHERGWSDSYLLTMDNLGVGYGSVKRRKVQDGDTIFKYFVVQPFSKSASGLFKQLGTSAT